MDCILFIFVPCIQFNKDFGMTEVFLGCPSEHYLLITSTVSEFKMKDKL